MTAPLDATGLTLWTQVRPWTPLFQYPHDGDAEDRIIVTRSDYECLEPDFPLNRTVFDFVLRVIVADRRRSPLGSDLAFNNDVPLVRNMARDVHAFPSDFYTRLRRITAAVARASQC